MQTARFEPGVEQLRQASPTEADASAERVAPGAVDVVPGSVVRP